jgi:hypothetical protein
MLNSETWAGKRKKKNLRKVGAYPNLRKVSAYSNLSKVSACINFTVPVNLLNPPY